MAKLLAFCLLFVIHSLVYAQEIPDFSANYLVRLNGIQAGELKRALKTDSSGLRHFTSSTQAKGVFAFFKPDIIEELSIWSLDKNQVKPQFYRYQRMGGKKEKTLEMAFNWQNMQVNIDDKKHPWQLKIEPNTLDKLVYQISLMKDLSPNIEELNYRIADGGKLKNYQIRVIGKETITTPLGEIDTIKLTRHRNKDEDRETTLWCSPALDYMPVKLEHIEDETTFTAVIRQLKGFDTSNVFTTTLKNEQHQ